MDFKKKSLTYNDSSLSDDHDCLKYLRDYLDGEYSKFFQSEIDLSSWKFINQKVVVVIFLIINPPYLYMISNVISDFLYLRSKAGF